MANAVGAELHPAIARLASLAAATHPVAARELGGVFERVLAPVAEARAWSGSALARTGSPVEVAFTSTDAASLRLTLEAAPPALDPRERLRRSAALYEELASSSLPRDVRRLVDGASPRLFGAWLGVRLGAAQPTWKLYVDTSHQAGEPFSLPVAAHVTMVAYDGASDRVESYYRAEALGISGVLALGRTLGLVSESEAVLTLLEQAVGRPLRGALPSCDLGFSISVPRATQSDVRLTLYGFAGSLFGGDGRCRAAILRLCASHGWRFPLYERVSEPLRDARGLAMHHCMFGITASAGLEPAISFGISPPAEEAA
jgi:hypothetical protein